MRQRGGKATFGRGRMSDPVMVSSTVIPPTFDVRAWGSAVPPTGSVGFLVHTDDP